MKLEHSLSSWRIFGEDFIIHTDGTISAIAEIDGYDMYMNTTESVSAHLNSLRSLIETAPLEVSFEFHIQRRRDKQQAKKFAARPLKRNPEFLKYLRGAYARHLEDYLYTNRVFMVVQWHNLSLSGKIWQWLLPDGPFAALNCGMGNYERLEEFCGHRMPDLKGLRWLEGEEAIEFLFETSHHYPCQALPAADDYMLRDVLTPSGEKRGGLYHTNSMCIKPFLMYFYPEPNMRFLTDILASLPIELDIALYLRRCDYAAFLRKSGGDEIRQEQQIARADVEAEKRLGDIATWRRYVAENNLQIFNNAFYFKLYGDKETISDQASTLSMQLISLGAVIESERLTEHAIIYSLPTNMYRGKFMRQDHTEMVMSLLPAVRFKRGNGHQEAFVATNFTFTGFNYANKGGSESYHSLTIAKTGSGKGVMNCARIAQLFGLGYDFYAIEIGNTYEFLFKLLGGDYVAIDPDKSVINPFPLCKEADEKLSSALVSPTIRSLARILTDGRLEMSVHEIAVCELAMRHIYRGEFVRKHGVRNAPTLAHFHLGLTELKEKGLNEKQKYARDSLALNVSSFLDTTIGERFKEKDNVNLDASLFGADFKKLKDEPQLLMTYLTFLSLRYGQKALFRRTPTFIVIDELHEFVRVDKATIRTLCAQIARMGRKESGYISLITQEIDDIAALDPALINQMFIANLLYTEGGHTKAREHFGSLNDKAYATWRDYQQTYPDYRAAMVGFGGQWFDVFLTYPREFIALADTRPEALALKEKLMRQHTDMQTAYQKLLKHYD